MEDTLGVFRIGLFFAEEISRELPRGALSETIMQETRREYASKTNDYLVLQKSIQLILECDGTYIRLVEWWGGRGQLC